MKIFCGFMSASLLAVLLAVPARGEDDSACLELLYATSVNMPEEEYGPEMVFDGDTATCWATMPGAGPDEGLFFSFEEPLDIRSIMVDLVPAGEGFEGIDSYQLYVNGIEGGVRSGSGSHIWINRPVKSVFIRIRSTDSMDWDSMGIRYTGELLVGIREVTVSVEDKDGNDIPLSVVPIRSVSGSIGASSSLEPEEAYSPDFLFDSRPAFGWADGHEDLTGEGEHLTFVLDEPRRIEKIRIWNGYHRSATHFQQNERVAELSFGIYGEDPGVYRLEDVMEPQEIELDYPLEGQRFWLDVLEIYPGDVYRDLVLSEMRFFDGDEWFVVDTGEGRERKLGILEWARSATAGSVIDRQLYSRRFDDEDGLDFHAQTLVLRSGGSFVIWMIDEWEDGEEHMYADGNWQVIDDERVRIFGRLQRVGRYEMEPYDPYAGSWPDQGQDTQRLTVFSDTLRIDGSTVSSRRGLFEDFTY